MEHTENVQARNCADSFKVTKKSLKQFIINCALVNKVRRMSENTTIPHVPVGERYGYHAVKNHLSTFHRPEFVLDLSGLHGSDSFAEGASSVDMDISYGYPEEEFNDHRSLPPLSPARTKTPKSSRRIFEQILGGGNISPLMTSSPVASRRAHLTPKSDRPQNPTNFAISPTSSPRPLSPILFSPRYGPSSLRNPGRDGDGTILLQVRMLFMPLLSA